MKHKWSRCSARSPVQNANITMAVTGTGFTERKYDRVQCRAKTPACTRIVEKMRLRAGRCSLIICVPGCALNALINRRSVLLPYVRQRHHRIDPRWIPVSGAMMQRCVRVPSIFHRHSDRDGGSKKSEDRAFTRAGDWRNNYICCDNH